MESAPRTKRYTKRSDLMYRRVADEGLVYDLKAGALHALNPLAREIWERCDGKHTSADIVDALLKKYDVKESTVRRHVRTTINELRKLNLLVNPELEDSVAGEES